MPTYDLRRHPQWWARGRSGHVCGRPGHLCAGAGHARGRSGHLCARRATLPLLLLALTAGCDFPTSLPKWDTQWLIPVQNTSLTASQLLPASVGTSADGLSFVVSVAPVTISRSLGELCGACNALSGLTVPKPAFTATVSDTLRLPADVAAATLGGGTVPVTISNGFGFDPIRPSATARGTLALTLSSGAATAGTLTLDGATDSVPRGSTSTRAVPLATGAAVSGKIAAVLSINSPAGDPVRIDASQRFSVTAAPQSSRVSDVTVAVNGKSVSIQPVNLSVSDIDQSLVDRVRAGTLVLNIVNPFGVTGTLTMIIAGPGVTIQKPIQLGSGSTTQRVPFTEDEIRSILGKSGVSFTAGGTVNAAQPVKLTPSQAVQVVAQLELTLGSTAGGAADIVPLH